ncbi:hypothetical protein KI387_001969, partial [Taxus chinensis]
MALGDQFGNCESNSRTMEENGGCVINCVVEESTSNKPVPQEICEAEFATHYDSLHVGNEVMMMDAIFLEVESLRTVTLDARKIPSSTTKDDTKKLETNEEQGEFPTEYCSQCNQSIDHTFGYLTSPNSTSGLDFS